MLHSKWFLSRFTLCRILLTKYRVTMQHNKNDMVILDRHTYEEICEKAAKYTKTRKANTESVRKKREKELTSLENEKNKPILREIPKVKHLDVVVGGELERISKFGIADRMIEVENKFRTVQKYKKKDGEESYIIQMEHNQH